jgi:hypothetical protein
MWYPKVTCCLLWFSDTDIKQTAGRRIFVVWEDMWDSIEQAAFCSLYVYCCRWLKNLVDIWIFVYSLHNFVGINCRFREWSVSEVIINGTWKCQNELLNG